jgi:hypothetical protein
MSDQTINQTHASLKHINARLEKLEHSIEELQKLAYRYYRLSYEINHIDVMAFEVQQDFLLLKKAWQRRFY